MRVTDVELTLRSRNHLDQNYKLSPHHLIFDGGVGAQQSEAENAVEHEQALDGWFLAVTIVEKRYVDAEHLSDLLEPRRADPVDALFVFLHLLETDIEVLSQSYLRDAFFRAPQTNSSSHLNVRCWREVVRNIIVDPLPPEVSDEFYQESSKKIEAQASLEGPWMLEMDPVVSWYVKFLLLNIFKVPDPLMEFAEASDETSATIDLLRYLMASRLAEEKLGLSQCVQQVVASKKLLRSSNWLLSGKEPDRRTHKYMGRLVRNALRFLQKQGAE